MCPSSSPPRRRILYIRHRRGKAISDAFRLNQDEWLDTLSALADVTLMDTSFDMDALCNRAQPDFILYESPLYFPQPLVIDKADAHPHIPRLAFFMQDPFCPMRVHFLRRLDDLGIRWIFTHLPEALLRQSPELKARTFSVNLLFDDTIFHDYGLPKDIPVSVFGGFLLPEIYAWRSQTTRAITDHFPTLIYTHPGYKNPAPRHTFPVTGEAYAKLLNRSYFSLADVTRLDYPVRKHLEIPAAGSVLVAPDAAALKPYGFVDMKNCVLGQGQELFDKMASVADQPTLYESIRREGYDLVHRKYTRRQWCGILDFYEYLRTLPSGATIEQQGILGPFTAKQADLSPAAIMADYPDSAVSALFKKWLSAILDPEKFDETDDDFLKAPGWMPHMEEPFVLMGILILLKGDLAQARALFLAPQKFRAEQSGFEDYDPEEIAWLSLIAALIGDKDLMAMTRRHSTAMRHLSLRRVRWLGDLLAGHASLAFPPDDVQRPHMTDRLSVHWTGQLPLPAWLSLIDRILVANGQSRLPPSL